MRDEFEERPRLIRRGYYRPTQSERDSASMCHLLGILLHLFGPLIVWSTKKDDSRFVDFHGREAINFGITLMIVNFVLGLIFAVFAFVTCGIGALAFPVMFIPMIWGLIASISAMNAAKSGKWYRYPASIRFIGPPSGMESEVHEVESRFADDEGNEIRVPVSPVTSSSGSWMWVWIVGGVLVLLFGTCLLGGLGFFIYQIKNLRSNVAAVGPGRPAAGAGAFTPLAPPVIPAKPELPKDPIERALIEMKSTDPWERGRAADALALQQPPRSGRRDVIKALEQMRRDPEQFPREAATRALVVWAGPEDVSILLDLFQTTSFGDKHKIMATMGKSKDARVIKPLANAMRDGSYRQAAVEALKNIGPNAEDEVLLVLNDTNISAKRAAIEVLSAVGTSKCLPELDKLAQERQAIVAAPARAAVAAIKARRR